MAFDSLEIRRNSIIRCLELTKLCEILGKSPWTCITNSSYKLCTPCVSVVVTLYNYSEYIHECLNSVCASNTSGLPGGFEIVVIDDCSTDNSANLVEDYISKSEIAICLVRKSFNTGVGDARNVGIKLARSKYVFMLDADNGIYPNCLTTLYNEIQRYGYAAVYGMINKFDNSTREGIGLISCFEWNVYDLVRGPYIDAMAMLDKGVIVKLGGYSTELIQHGWLGWEDYDLWLKLAQYDYACKLVPQILSFYRVHTSSQINSTNRYLGSITNYFHKKFSSLVSRYKKLDTIFGFSTNPIIAEQQLTALGAIEHFNNSVQHQDTQAELKRLQATIAAMESSKFWQMRKAWFKLKQTIGLNKDE